MALKNPVLRIVCVAAAAFAVWSCAESPPNAFPEADRAAFLEACRGGEAFCACSWDGITRAFTAEEWAAAQARLNDEGLADPRIAQITSACRA